MQQATLDKLIDAAHAAGRISHILADLADALHRTHQTLLARELTGMAEVLENAAADIRSGAGAAANEALSASTEAASNMVRAALAGIEHASRAA